MDRQGRPPRLCRGQPWPRLTGSRERLDLCIQKGPRRGQLPRYRDHGQHDPYVPVTGGAQQGAQLDADQVRMTPRKSKSPQTEKRITFAFFGNAGYRLVTSGVEGADGHVPSLRPPNNLT